MAKLSCLDKIKPNKRDEQDRLTERANCFDLFNEEEKHYLSIIIIKLFLEHFLQKMLTCETVNIEKR